MKLILHTCCAPDLTISHKIFNELNYEILTYFYNPNIDTKTEYELREFEVKKLNKIFCLNEIKEYYNRNDYYNIVQDSKNCEKCIRIRLEKTAEICLKNRIQNYSTTLLASPRKSHELIKKIADEIDRKYNLNFIYVNLRKNNGVSKAAQMCRTYDIYRQKYCGCEYSKKESENIEIKMREKTFENINPLIKMDKEIFNSLYKKSLLKIPEDISFIKVKKNFFDIIYELKPLSILIKREIASKYGINFSGRYKIKNWKAKIILW